MLTGLGWGALGYTTVELIDLDSSLCYPIFILGSGVASGGTFSLSPKPKLATTYVLFILMPPSIASMSHENWQLGSLLGLMMFVYMAFLILQSKNNFQVLKKNLDLVNLTAKIKMIELYLNSKDIQKDKINANLKSVESTVERIAKIVRGLRMFSRDNKEDPLKEMSLDEIVEDTVVWFGPRLKECEIQLFLELESEGATVLCRDAQVSQVILNLCNNSIEAIKSLQKKWIKI